MNIRRFDDLLHTHKSAWSLRLQAARLTDTVQTIGEGYHEAWDRDERSAAISELDRLTQAVAELRAKLEKPVESRHQGMCLTPMDHSDGSSWPCILPAVHRLFDGEPERHIDQHGHYAEPIVHAAAIREVQAVQDARDRGEIT
jgi:hypothetical protein